MLWAEPATPPTVEDNIENTLSLFEKWQHGIIDWLTDSGTWEMILVKAIKIALIVLITRIVIRVVYRMINHTVIKREKNRMGMNPRRLLTVGKLLKNVTSLVMNFIMILLILSEFNVNLAPLLAGAGVVGLAVGFGAQSLVKDVMTGFFIIFEDQFAVGDVIKVGQFQGTVEMIGLRSTRIHSWTGEVHIIPNGIITEVTNFSLNNSIAVVDISIAYEENVEEAIDVMSKALETLPERNENVVTVPQVLGVQMLAASEVTIRIIAECRPYTQAGVSRQMNAEMKKALEDHGIEIPYPRLVTYQRVEQGGVDHGA
ncbi:mechanosensitive ion channel family protein [Paenibacillus sp. MER TA 81-3]|uniref:mechanosensitive ion channel family protein n=1 Tax=Paenibacillus sp. MER TA 81-3 TaxID=2939573 RepID=UPI00203F56AB|nr:mechanosensitive ion channel family protein [Paenibacillus sp. MER TA 81-3]MCM3340997.1 mechanosensitive ion channel family protein [Paenibacillus sp. MER TA 81-3]